MKLTKTLNLFSDKILSEALDAKTISINIKAISDTLDKIERLKAFLANGGADKRQFSSEGGSGIKWEDVQAYADHKSGDPDFNEKEYYDFVLGRKKGIVEVKVVDVSKI